MPQVCPLSKRSVGWIVAAALLLPTPALCKRGARPALIATIGPASSRVSTVRRMLRRGARILRFNLSHMDAEATRLASQRVRQAAGKKQPRLLFDLPGGKARLHGLPEGGLALQKGEPFVLRAGRRGLRRRTLEAKRAYVDYPALAAELQVGDKLLLDDAKLKLQVTAVHLARGEVETRVIEGGQLFEKKGLAVAGRDLPFPALTAKDRRKLAIAVDNGASLIGVSMVQSPENLRATRAELQRLGAPRTKLVAKIESQLGLKNLDAIIAEADMVMIARGDLGAAVGAENLHLAQREIAKRCRAKGVPFIVATDLMSNLMRAPHPSRANAADMRRARAQGAWGLMLNETAMGPYPVETVAEAAALLR